MTISGPIIVVDDDLDDQLILSEVLKKFVSSDSIKFFTDARAVIQYLHETQQFPFIILCDINMPLINGFDLRATLLKDKSLSRKSIPFVFYSTSATNDQVEKAFDLTVQGFFLKGHSMEEVERRMRIILEYWTESRRPYGKIRGAL